MRVEVERRTAKRYGTCGRVEIPRPFRRATIPGVVLDVSARGCGVSVPCGMHWNAEDGRDEDVRVEVRFRTSYLSFSAVSVVRNVQVHGGRGGMVLGLEFVELSARGRADIAGLARDRGD